MRKMYSKFKNTDTVCKGIVFAGFLILAAAAVLAVLPDSHGVLKAAAAGALAGLLCFCGREEMEYLDVRYDELNPVFRKPVLGPAARTCGKIAFGFAGFVRMACHAVCKIANSDE